MYTSELKVLPLAPDKSGVQMNSFKPPSINYPNGTRLAKRREILIFPRMAGNTGNSREILVIPRNCMCWEIGPYPSRKLKIYFMTAITIYAKQKIITVFA